MTETEKIWENNEYGFVKSVHSISISTVLLENLDWNQKLAWLHKIFRLMAQLWFWDIKQTGNTCVKCKKLSLRIIGIGARSKHCNGSVSLKMSRTLAQYWISSDSILSTEICCLQQWLPIFLSWGGFSLRRWFILTFHSQGAEFLSYNKLSNCTCLGYLMSALMNGIIIT